MLSTNERMASHFCLLHDDIVPEPLWLDKMMRIMEEQHADILSVVVPLKNDKGLTSTALDVGVGDEDPHWRVKRLTLKEIYNDYEPTFTHEKLLVNTGLMLVDLRKPWVENVWFAFEDKIIPDPKAPGEFQGGGRVGRLVFLETSPRIGRKVVRHEGNFCSARRHNRIFQYFGLGFVK